MIQIENIAFGRGSRQLVQGLTAQIHPRQRIGLIGQNGCGKSSFLALLRGELDADGGHLTFPADWSIASVKQETPSLNIRALDYVLDGHQAYRDAERAIKSASTPEEIAQAHEKFADLNGYAQEAKASELLFGLGFNHLEQQKTVAEFSGGWRMRLNLAQALIAPADLLLLDEPTNHLDLDAIIWLQDYLKKQNTTQIIIAHDREFLDELCTHILHFENQTGKLYSGNYESFERQYHAQKAQTEALFQKEQLKKAHLEDFVRRFRAKASKAKQAQSRLKALEKLQLSPPSIHTETYQLNIPNDENPPNPLLVAENIQLAYDDKIIIQNFKIRIGAGSRIGLLGRNGAGKSTLMKCLAGVLLPKSGEMNLHQKTKIAYFTQHQLDNLNPEESALWHWQKICPKSTEQEGRNFLGGYGFRGEQIEAPIKQFSGGEKARLALALLVVQKPNLLLLDEPTNHLDIQMRDALTEALQNYEGALILIAHDRALLRASCDEFYLIGNQKALPFSGDLEDYQELLFQSQNPIQKKEEKPVNQKRLDAEKREKLRPFKQKVQKYEQEIEKINQQLEKISTELANEALYEAEQKEQLKKVLQQEALLKQKAEELENLWFEALAELENMEKGDE